MKFKNFYLYIFLIILFCAIASYLTVLAPLYSGNIIDILFGENPSLFFPKAIQLLKIYFIIFLSYCLEYEFLTSFTKNFSQFLRSKIFNKIHKLNISTLSSISYGGILNNFSIDIENISNAIFQGIPKIFGGAIIIVATLYYVFNINFIIAISLILVAPLIYFISRFIAQKTSSLFKKRAETLDSLNSFAEESIKNIKTIQDFNYFSKLSENFENLNNSYFRVGQKAQFYASLANPSTRFVSNISYCFIGILGLFLTSKGYITFGNIATALLYTNVFIRPFNEFTSVFTELQTASTSFKRIKQFLELPEEIENFPIFPLPNSTQFKGEIEFKNVYFSYVPNEPVLKNISFHIKPGEHFALVGKTGCGKTTLINLLMRFYDVNSGEILIDGINIKNIDKNLLRKNIGIVLQDNKLFTDTILSNISYGSNNSNEIDILQASQLAYADKFIQNLPYKYSTYISSPKTLSAGETQLITIARMILYHPSILILDEATSNVDLLTEQAIQKSFSNLIKRSTSLTIAHRLSTIVNSDTILYMENGEIVEMGSHKDLISLHGNYFELYNSQFN